MSKSLDRLTKLVMAANDSGNRISGGFGSLKGGIKAVAEMEKPPNAGCTNKSICSNTNQPNCTNSNFCQESTNYLCSNTGFCGV